MAAGIPYSDDEKSQLRKWWNAGISTAEIGRRLGRTKNSVVGATNRLDPPVTRRESPIKPIAIPRPEPVRATTETLPPLASAPPPPAHQPRKFMDPLWQAPKVRVPPPQPQVPPAGALSEAPLLPIRYVGAPPLDILRPAGRPRRPGALLVPSAPQEVQTPDPEADGGTRCRRLSVVTSE